MITKFNKFIQIKNLISADSLKLRFSQDVIVALRPTKQKTARKTAQYFADSKYVRTVGGKGGDGCVSFLQLWCNERAGPDGGDGGNGGHVIFEASPEVRNLNYVKSLIKGKEGEKGQSKKCHGKNADHTIIKLPLGTIVKNCEGQIVADLDREFLKFVASRGGSGGKGNTFFASDTEQSPKICEYGADGEDTNYFLELRTIADVGLIGLPNAGKSTLLQRISRAHTKVASYPFTTLKPQIGIVNYNNYEQISFADLPGLIKDSHKNKGLGIEFLRHAERCSILVILLDGSNENLINDYYVLLHELKMFSSKLIERPKIIAINKSDLVLPNQKEAIENLEKALNTTVVKISAKFGTNIENFLDLIGDMVFKK